MKYIVGWDIRETGIDGVEESVEKQLESVSEVLEAMKELALLREKKRTEK